MVEGAVEELNSLNHQIILEGPCEYYVIIICKYTCQRRERTRGFAEVMYVVIVEGALNVHY